MRGMKQRGFTLIELMITVAIVALLAAVAYPSYTSHVMKSNRTVAKAAMMEIANREQQYLLANRAYTSDLTQLSYTMPSEISNRYTITVAVTASPTYTITATPLGAQVSDGELTLNSAGVKTPASKW